MELFWKRRSVYGSKTMVKELKEVLNLGAIIQLWTTLLHLGSLWRSVTIIKPISYVVSLNLGNISTQFPRLTFGIY
jgi:hypothetical protein